MGDYPIDTRISPQTTRYCRNNGISNRLETSQQYGRTTREPALASESMTMAFSIVMKISLGVTMRAATW